MAPRELEGFWSRGAPGKERVLTEVKGRAHVRPVVDTALPVKGLVDRNVQDQAIGQVSVIGQQRCLNVLVRESALLVKDPAGRIDQVNLTDPGPDIGLEIDLDTVIGPSISLRNQVRGIALDIALVVPRGIALDGLEDPTDQDQTIPFTTDLCTGTGGGQPPGPV